MERGFSEWRVETTCDALGLPGAFVGAPWPGDDLAPEIGLLLPTYSDGVHAMANRSAGVAAFLADPNLVPEQLARTILQRGGRWIANLPSVAQHEDDFRHLLAEVDLDHPCEMRALGRMAAAGISTLATVCRPADVEAAAACAPDAIFALPPVLDFADGFPSLDRRLGLEADVAAATSVPILGLRAPGEPACGRPATLSRPVQISR